MFAINIVLVIAGIVISIGTAIFWSRAAKISNNVWDGKSSRIVSRYSTINKLVKWLYHHRSKFNVLVATIVTIIEFFAVMPF